MSRIAPQRTVVLSGNIQTVFAEQEIWCELYYSEITLGYWMLKVSDNLNQTCKENHVEFNTHLVRNMLCCIMVFIV